MTAVPLFANTFLASFKSIFTFRCCDITSAIPLVAVLRTSLAFPKACVKVRSPYISINLSLFIINNVSTCFFSSSNPSLAYFFL